MFKKILIANRGEIACRIIRTAKKMGIKTVTIYSDIDKNALYVQQSDEAFPIGGASTQSSYLNFESIITIAKDTFCEAIHPGYGFLSENPDFAESVVKQGLQFIGPSAKAIRWMGSKAKSKEILQKADIPLIPGIIDATQNEQTLLNQSKAIGFPVLIKASMGGGGKGMRVVHHAEEFIDALKSCKREAYNSFGNDEVIIEKYLENPRHIEVQIFGDQFGSTVYLFERDCSIQRRHQKIIEEAPAPFISETLRKKIGETAVKIAKTIDYTNAGTVEFLVLKDETFYFMEMNTRLQVEHPITEMITGIDLVEWQLKVAAGEKLPKKQEEIHLQGHSFEARLYAEDPALNFLPATGTIQWLQWPKQDQFTRIEAGIQTGDRITVYYDPLLAKLISYGETRKEAVLNMQRLLDQTHLLGVANNLSFLRAIFSLPSFATEVPNTDFLKKHASELESRYKIVPMDEIPKSVLQEAQLAYLNHKNLTSKSFVNLDPDNLEPHSPWDRQDFWRLNASSNPSLLLNYQGMSIKIPKSDFHKQNPKNTLFSHITPEFIYVYQDGREYLFTDPFSSKFGMQEKPKGQLSSPMPGIITNLFVEVGSAVMGGQPLLTLEAMKMEHTIKAPFAGIIRELPYHIGDTVEAGFELCILEENHASS